MALSNPQAAAAYAALSQESRLTIVRLLLRAEPHGMAVGEIGQHFALAPATLSFHLSGLRDAGLVISQREGRVIRYRANVAALRDISDYLFSECCDGQPEQCRTDTAA